MIKSPSETFFKPQAIRYHRTQ